MIVLTSAKSVRNSYLEKVNFPVSSVQYVRIFALNVQLNMKNMSMMRIVKNVQNHAENVSKNVKNRFDYQFILCVDNYQWKSHYYINKKF